MTKRDSHKKGNEHEPEDYLFMKETIKRRPQDVKFYLKRGIAAAVCGIIFGCCAAVTFTSLYPYLSDKYIEKEDVSLSGAKPGPVGTGIPADDVTGEETVSGAEAPDKESNTLSSEEESPATAASMEIYESVYQDALRIAEKPMKAMVRVSGLSGDSDLLDDSFLTYGEEEGVVFLNNETDLYILTNYKKLNDADVIRVTFSNGASADGVLCKSDSRTGMAVVRVPLTLLTEKDLEEIYVASLSDSYSLNNEKPVIAIGSPSGYFGSVIYGLVTSVSGRMTAADCEYTLLGTNMMGSTGSSGVLLNMEGEVVGIIVRTQSDENILKAVSIAQLRPLIETLSNGEALRYLGIRGSSISAEQSVNMEIPRGIYVNSVEGDSPAMIAGIQSGDIITALNEEEINDMQSYMTELQKLAVGTKVKITVSRRGSEGKFVEIGYHLTIEEK